MGKYICKITKGKEDDCDNGKAYEARRVADNYELLETDTYKEKYIEVSTTPNIEDLRLYDDQTEEQKLSFWIKSEVKPIRKKLMGAQQWRIDRYNRDIFLEKTPADNIGELHNYMEDVKIFPDGLMGILDVDTLEWPEIPI